jgi:enamine deaminase RidA (YjgF/YER057c/UK114 family)
MSDPRLVRYDTADPQAGGQRRPFAKAVRAGDYVHVSGQVPTIAGEVVQGGIVAQTEQVIKVTCWLDDPRDFSSFNAVFEKHFGPNPPARSTVQSRLMVDAKVEIDAIAWKPL